MVVQHQVWYKYQFGKNKYEINIHAVSTEKCINECIGNKKLKIPSTTLCYSLGDQDLELSHVRVRGPFMGTYFVGGN